MCKYGVTKAHLILKKLKTKTISSHSETVWLDNDPIVHKIYYIPRSVSPYIPLEKYLKNYWGHQWVVYYPMS